MTEVDLSQLPSQELFDLAQRGNAEAFEILSHRALGDVANVVARELVSILDENPPEFIALAQELQPAPHRTSLLEGIKSAAHRIHLPKL